MQSLKSLKSLQAALSAGEDTREGRRRLTKVEEKKILAPLLRLRQACCHPQARPRLLCIPAVILHGDAVASERPRGARGRLQAVQTSQRSMAPLLCSRQAGCRPRSKADRRRQPMPAHATVCAAYCCAFC